ncbi:hypothetical protein EPUS_02375 [Endocarpon pusillum Z07020]|uniref:Uncharacterized protein n=1 Tax=Endocarpon pusillum (strain Z07020 / HMAS-L-300199) TaxID=1263415 RepID=U1GFG8_ENDPU|nr:uncharacterized protein EPUS_02375 [Endocarpon pusillum Z07020]ERF70853.1 hypothetical protein EPUS_02375 [Endocarpon pusillum Z07020]
MELDDLIYEEGCASLRFKSVPVQAFEIRVFEVRCDTDIDIETHKTNIAQSGRADWQESVISHEQGILRIRPWLDAQVDFKSARHINHDPSRIIGGLRLLVQKWTREDGALDADVPIMPFLKSDLTRLWNSSVYRVPSHWTSPAVSKYQQILEDRLAITCQSPRLQTCMTLVLSHDPRKKNTSGFFGYTQDEGDKVLATLKKSAHLALHPLLIPALIHSAWFKIMFDQYAQTHRELRLVQQNTDFMVMLLNDGRSQMSNFDREIRNTNDSIRRAMIEQHAQLSTALSDFVGKLGSALAEGLELVRKLYPAAYKDYGLEAYIKHWISRTERQLEHREQLLKRIDVQIQVLYTFMQQADSRTNIHIAEDTRKDSSAMKSLALITTIFLPTTALATIFSVSSFFSDAADGSGRLVVSSQFWIFWAVAAPITFFTVVLWFIWINRKEVKKFRDTYKHRFSDEDVERTHDSSSDSDRSTSRNPAQASRSRRDYGGGTDERAHAS